MSFKTMKDNLFRVKLLPMLNIESIVLTQPVGKNWENQDILKTKNFPDLL